MGPGRMLRVLGQNPASPCPLPTLPPTWDKGPWGGDFLTLRKASPLRIVPLLQEYSGLCPVTSGF